MLSAAAAMACGTLVVGGMQVAETHAANVEPPIVPTVHPTLLPSAALTTPLVLRADSISVWKPNDEQRALLSGHVIIDLGYRTMQADTAAVYLTPGKEGGESTFDVAIYLVGNVRVQETWRKGTSTIQTAPELLVTSRITQSVQIVGLPVSKAESDSPIVKRGEELRQELLTRPAPPVHIPHITTVDAEYALQAGWIARGPNNRIVLGPGDAGLIKPGPGTTGTTAVTAVKPKPRPQVFATGDRVEYKTMGNERVTIIHGAYLFRDTLDGKPPIEVRAQQMVLFSPPTNPSGTPTTAPAGATDLGVARAVTGVYLEGDITLQSGNQTVRAEKLYYDFTSDRAIMLDAILSTVDELRNVPLYMKADEIRQIARGEYAAKSAKFSTSEFYLPHYHIGASDTYLQDITPRDEAGNPTGPAAFEFNVKDATINARGVPIFYWPYLAGDTNKNEIPLRHFRVGSSKTYGLSIETSWDIFGLFGQREPKGISADLNLDYFGKRGPAGGVDALWKTDDSHGLLLSYATMDHGQDNLGSSRDGIPLANDGRGRAVARHMQDLGDDWTLSLEGAYVSDPNFLAQYFQNEYNADKEPETSFYLKRQRETEALSFLAKWTLFDFTASADQVDDQFTTRKLPEAKYWRIGDSVLDMFTYYSQSGIANLQMSFTNFTPTDLALNPSFVGLPAAPVPASTKYRDYYRSLGWTDGSVLRGDSRHELDMPLQLGDLKVTPYVTGRVTAWDQAFPETASGGNTVRLWGAGGVRAATQFWRVYDDVDSTFWDVHRVRHVIEPQFNIFVAGADQDRSALQPFERDVEGLSTASGSQLLLAQKWQTKRGGPGHWRNVDWVVLNVAWNQFWNQDQPSTAPFNAVNPGFFPANPVRGYYFASRPELSLVRNSINVDGTWRVGERVRILGELDYGLDSNRVEQFATGVAVDQTDTLSYFFGNRYIDQLDTDQWTVGVEYKLTRKYTIMATESYDFLLQNNILSSVTLVRHMPRFNAAISVTYDANNADTSVVFSAWPEGFQEAGLGNRSIQSH